VVSASLVASTAALVVVAVAAGSRFARHRRASDRDVFLAFVPYAIVGILTVNWTADSEWTARWLLPFLYVQPVLFCLLLRHVGRNPLVPALIAGAGGLVSIALLWNASPDALDGDQISTPLLLASVAVYVVPNLWLGAAFTQAAIRSTGVTRTRLAWAALASILFMVSLFTYDLAAGTGGWAAVLDDGVNLALAVAFLFGFAPPRWLQRAWQSSAYYRFTLATRSVGPDTPADQLEPRLLAGARSVLDAAGFRFSAGPVVSAGHLSAPTAMEGDHAYLVARFAGRRLFPVDDQVTLDSLASHAGRVLAEAGRLRAEVGRREAAEQDAAFKASFLRHFGHEIANPMSPLRIHAELLRDQATPDQMRRLDIIRRNIVRIDDLIREVSAVAQAIDPRAPRDIRLADVGELVEQSAATFEEVARRARCTIEVQRDGDCTAAVDAVRMGQVFDNLLSNAIKYSPDGGLIRATVAPDGGAIRLRVQDSGLGFTPVQSSRLFRTYSRVHKEVAPAIPGSGLGLFLVQEVARAHGGRVEAESAGPGLGSCFTVWVTSQTPSAERAPSTQTGTPAATPAAAPDIVPAV
jgi:signal transduction histidine kinase